MDFAVWRALAARCAHWLAQDGRRAASSITHGTDTLEETAFFLQARAGAGQAGGADLRHAPATALAPDGPQNMRRCGGGGGRRRRARRAAWSAPAPSTARRTCRRCTPTGSTRSAPATPGRSATSRRAGCACCATGPRPARPLGAHGCLPSAAAVAAGGDRHEPRRRERPRRRRAGAPTGVAGAGGGRHRQRHACTTRWKRRCARRRPAACRCGARRAARRAGCCRTPGDAARGAGALSPVKARIALMLELLRTDVSLGHRASPSLGLSGPRGRPHLRHRAAAGQPGAAGTARVRPRRRAAGAAAGAAEPDAWPRPASPGRRHRAC